jgi:hypothetical protein
MIVDIEKTGATGAEKKAAVISLLTSGIPVLEASFGISLPDALILKWADPVIDALVAVENLIGTFTATKTTTTAA